MEYEKVKEPNKYNNYCERCDEYHCADCIDYHEVEFSITENTLDYRPDIKPQYQDWKGEKVCPWCYNQLVEKHGR